jgi:hypothetical protein
MHSRTKRTLFAGLLALLIAVSASAAPEGRRESGDWLVRQFIRVVQQVKNLFGPSPLDETTPIPPKP